LSTRRADRDGPAVTARKKDHNRVRVAAETPPGQPRL
jgi:hypothetical protein